MATKDLCLSIGVYQILHRGTVVSGYHYIIAGTIMQSAKRFDRSRGLDTVLYRNLSFYV